MWPMTVGSLFAGIGGFDLAAQRCGLPVIWQVENDPFCRAVLQKHWPSVPKYGDIRQLQDLPYADIITGGFPCQDISSSYHSGPGLSGPRSGLWRQMVRTLRLVGPRYVIVENVAMLLSRGMGTVLGDLADSGYDTEWDCLSGCQFGAPHTRDRVFIVAHTRRISPQVPTAGYITAKQKLERHSWWQAQSNLDRMADGIPRRLDRLCALGNAVIPQIGEWVFRQIIHAEEDSRE